MDQKLYLCPRCETFAMTTITAAEVPQPLLYVCGNCLVTVEPEAYQEWMLARVEEPEPEPPKLLDRLKAVFRG
jgi:transcription elongation factor Elf1